VNAVRSVHPEPPELVGHAQVVAQRGVPAVQTHGGGLDAQLEPSGFVKILQL
jgi:hypothetical protein